MSDEHSTTIGREKQTNRGLREDERTFVDESASLTTPRPPTTERCVALNRGPWVAARPPLDAARRARATRSCSTRGRSRTSPPATSPGAISVALDGGSFATRAAFVLDAGEPVVVHARSAAEAAEAARLLWAVGLFEQRGYVRRRRRDRDDADRHRARARAAARRRAGHAGARRARAERARGGAAARARSSSRTARCASPRRRELDRARPVYTICASGPRATLAASLLARRASTPARRSAAACATSCRSATRLVESR